jgi:hypothetical protein
VLQVPACGLLGKQDPMRDVERCPPAKQDEHCRNRRQSSLLVR